MEVMTPVSRLAVVLACTLTAASIFRWQHRPQSAVIPGGLWVSHIARIDGVFKHDGICLDRG